MTLVYEHGFINTIKQPHLSKFIINKVGYLTQISLGENRRPVKLGFGLLYYLRI